MTPRRLLACSQRGPGLGQRSPQVSGLGLAEVDGPSVGRDGAFVLLEARDEITMQYWG